MPESSSEDQAAALCTPHLEEVRKLRKFVRPKHSASPSEVHEALLDVRGRLDRMEGLLSDLSMWRAAARIRISELEQDALEAWDREATAKDLMHRSSGYEGKEERYAHWNLKTLKQRQRVRTAQRVADIFALHEDQARAAYRGLRDVREELLATLRYLQWEVVMER
jgi:hypothetical protein